MSLIILFDIFLDFSLVFICALYIKKPGIRETCFILLVFSLFNRSIADTLYNHQYAVMIWYFAWGFLALLQIVLILAKNIWVKTRCAIDPIIATLLLAIILLNFSKYFDKNIFDSSTFSNIYGLGIPILNTLIILVLLFPNLAIKLKNKEFYYGILDRSFIRCGIPLWHRGSLPDPESGSAKSSSRS